MHHEQPRDDTLKPSIRNQIIGINIITKTREMPDMISAHVSSQEWVNNKFDKYALLRTAKISMASPVLKHWDDIL